MRRCAVLAETAPAPPDDDAPLPPGTRIGTFRVKRLLGEGATGEVYLAQDVTLGRRVALKLVKRAATQRAGFDRFLTEARTTARFNHPHIVTIHALGEHEGRPYLALELIDGESLRARLRDGPLPAREAMRVVRAVAEALAEAHRHGVVHADLKPENIMVARDGRARVVDFGLAHLLGSGAQGVFGTRAYMAPEMWSGGAVSAAIDVWALGVVLHELCTGERPFSGAELAARVFGSAPFELPVASRGAPWAGVARGCLARDPEARPSAEDVARKLAVLLDRAAPVAQQDRCPFLGLAAFQRADAADYFGRRTELDGLVELLRTRTLVPIAGPSGIGKSSFVEAALVPRLEESGAWTIVRCRPGSAPIDSLARALDPESAAGLAASLRASPESLCLSLERVASERGGRVLLFIDQFEETFTLSSPEDAARFCACIAAPSSADDPWRVVLTVRDDFFGRLAESEAMRVHLGAVLPLGPMSRADLEAAIRGPLARAGYTTDAPDLPARIAADVERQPAGLPLLQFTCETLWTLRDTTSRALLAREYDAMGGAGGALAKHAERLLAQLAPEQIALTRALLLRLVSPDGTRRPRPHREAVVGLGPSAEDVVRRLLTHRLLVARRELDSDEAVLELAHEALATAWPQLARWLDETHEERALVNELEQAAALWTRRGRREDETWTGDALAQAVTRVARYEAQLPPDARQFLDDGIRRERRSRRRRRWALGGGMAALGIVAVASIGAALAFSEKEKQAIRQQEQIRLAAADMGLFELVLEPFDWDPERQAPAPPASLPPLEWQLHAVDANDPRVPGRPYTDTDIHRGERRVEARAVHEQVEARSGQAFLQVTARGGDCAPSWVFLKHLPGYIDRTAPERPAIRVPVPTCQASRAGMVEIPEGEFFRNIDGPTEGGDTIDERVHLPAFAIDRTEVTRNEFAQYSRLGPLSDDGAAPAPHLDLQRPDAGRLPIVGVNFFTARNFCRFMGKELPSIEQWQKALRGGVTVGGAENPAPRRDTPWITPARDPPANFVASESSDLAPVGSYPDDTSPYGVVDLAGNVSEWSADGAASARLRGLRVLLGGNWDSPPQLRGHAITWRNTHPDRYLDFAIGLRCVTGRVSR